VTENQDSSITLEPPAEFSDSNVRTMKVCMMCAAFFSNFMISKTVDWIQLCMSELGTVSVICILFFYFCTGSCKTDLTVLNRDYICPFSIPKN